MLTHSYDVKAAAEWRKIGIAIMYGSSKNGSPLSIGNYCFGIGRRTHIQGMVGYMESRSSAGDVINTRANYFRADGVSGYASAGRENIQAVSGSLISAREVAFGVTFSVLISWRRLLNWVPCI